MEEPFAEHAASLPFRRTRQPFQRAGRPPCERRRDYALVFFAMFLFAFMALAALVIDLGFARLAQRQMESGRTMPSSKNYAVKIGR